MSNRIPQRDVEAGIVRHGEYGYTSVEGCLMTSMRCATRRRALAGAIAVGLGLLSWAVIAADAPDVRPFLSRLKSMAHGYHSDAEWNEVFRQLNALTAEAEAAEAWTALVDLALARASALGDMLNRPREALAVLQDARVRYRDHAGTNMRRLYAREAELLASLGDEQGIGRLIAEFRASPFYDPEAFRYSGGQGRDVPLQIVRPRPRGDDSITITAMEAFRKQALTAPGRLFPTFEVIDQTGRTVRSSDLRGRIVLLDFWMPESVVWRRNVPNLLKVYRDFHARGFEIVGLCLSRSPARVEAFLSEQRLPWIVVVGNESVAAQVGLFGELGNFLLDANGVIVARNLSGADLSSAVEQATGRK